MIELNDYFFNTVDEFEGLLLDSESKEDLFNRCVKSRMSDVLNVQSSYFDEQLGAISTVLDNCNFKDINDIKKLSSTLNALHKCIARNRFSLIEHLSRLI